MKCTWQEFTEKLRIYRKNRENVPLQELKTKYAKGYNKLVSDLYQMAAEVLRDVICSGMYTMTCDTAERKELADRINQIIDSEKEAGHLRSIAHEDKRLSKNKLKIKPIITFFIFMIIILSCYLIMLSRFRIIIYALRFNRAPKN